VWTTSRPCSLGRHARGPHPGACSTCICMAHAGATVRSRCAAAAWCGSFTRSPTASSLRRPRCVWVAGEPRLHAQQSVAATLEPSGCANADRPRTTAAHHSLRPHSYEYFLNPSIQRLTCLRLPLEESPVSERRRGTGGPDRPRQRECPHRARATGPALRAPPPTPGTNGTHISPPPCTNGTHISPPPRYKWDAHLSPAPYKPDAHLPTPRTDQTHIPPPLTGAQRPAARCVRGATAAAPTLQTGRAAGARS
jgi:hypothetical protein